MRYRPSYTMLVVCLDPDEYITAEAGAMSYVSPAIEARTMMREGVWQRPA